MRFALTSLGFIFVIAGCTGSFGAKGKDKDNRPGMGEEGTGVALGACPRDPDCAIAGTCNQYECPDYWVCDDLATGGKRCTNVGPDVPDEGSWECTERDGTVECRRPGSGGGIPTLGGDSPWNCESQAEWVVCERGSGDFPSGGGAGDWNCWRTGDHRICESGPGAGWTCYDTPSGRECRHNNFNFPDDREWACYDTNAGTTCSAPGELPGGGGSSEWNCVLMAEFVICTDTTPEYPGGGGGSGGPGTGGPGTGGPGTGGPGTGGPGTGGPGTGGDLPGGGGSGQWDCYFAQEWRICNEGGTPGGGPGTGGPGTGGPGTGGPGTGGPGTGGPGTGGPGTGGPGVPGGGGEICVPYQQRWCDDHIYCSWGKQTCLPDGRWGPCIEPTVTRAGLTDRPDTACGCRFFYFNYECCEDQADRDGDGNPDCIIPEGHTPPACTSNGNLCSYCDVHTDCGDRSGNDACLFNRDGYAFCSQACNSNSDCGSGYTCNAISVRGGTMRQCVPSGGRCE